MARSLSALEAVTKAVIKFQPWLKDPRCIALPWRDDMYQDVQKRPLVIGLLLDDGVVRPHPPITRTLLELKDKLQAAGHRVVLWDPKNHKEVISIQDLYYTADGGEDILRDIQAGGEPLIEAVEALINRGQAISVYEYWQLNRRKLSLQKAFLDQWNNTIDYEGCRMDALLMPTLPHGAVPHKSTRYAF